MADGDLWQVEDYRFAQRAQARRHARSGVESPQFRGKFMQREHQSLQQPPRGYGTTPGANLFGEIGAVVRSSATLTAIAARDLIAVWTTSADVRFEEVAGIAFAVGVVRFLAEQVAVLVETPE
jgi:hypothetical protein